MREGKLPERALELLAEMQGRGLDPNVITFSAAISACEKGQQPERALELLAEMQGRAGPQRDPITALQSAHARRDIYLNVRLSCLQIQRDNQRMREGSAT